MREGTRRSAVRAYRATRRKTDRHVMFVASCQCCSSYMRRCRRGSASTTVEHYAHAGSRQSRSYRDDVVRGFTSVRRAAKNLAAGARAAFFVFLAATAEAGTVTATFVAGFAAPGTALHACARRALGVLHCGLSCSWRAMRVCRFRCQRSGRWERDARNNFERIAQVKSPA